MGVRFTRGFLFIAIFLAQGLTNQALAQKRPPPLLEDQATSSDFLPKEKRFQFQNGKNPNVLSKSLLRQFLQNRRSFEKMIDPHRGIWIVTYLGGEFDGDDGIYKSVQHLCRDTLQKKLPSFLKESREIMRSSDNDDVTKCQNDVAMPFCTIISIGEYGVGRDFIFTRNVKKGLTLWGVLIHNSSYRDELQKKENAFLKKAFETAPVTHCP